MAGKKNKKIGCLIPILIFVAAPLIVFLIQKPRGPEVLYDASVAKNHLVYFDVETVELMDRQYTSVTSRTRRTVRSGSQMTSIYRCTTADGDVILLYIENSTLQPASNKSFNPDTAPGSRIHGVKKGDGDSGVRFESMTPPG